MVASATVPEMHRIPILLVSLVLVATGCGDDDASTSTQATTPPGPSATTAAGEQSTTTAGANTTAPATTTTADTRAPLPAGATTAPDFELALGQGGIFTLSDEQRPVYMVFWAEW